MHARLSAELGEFEGAIFFAATMPLPLPALEKGRGTDQLGTYLVPGAPFLFRVRAWMAPFAPNGHASSRTQFSPSQGPRTVLESICTMRAGSNHRALPAFATGTDHTR